MKPASQLPRSHVPRRGRCLPLALAALTLALSAIPAAQAPAPAVFRRIAIFGSSVASGTGDESGQDGYAGLLRALLQPRGWEVVNQSKPGDNTKALMSRFEPDGRPQPGTRYLVPRPRRLRGDRTLPRQRRHSQRRRGAGQGGAVRAGTRKASRP